MMIRYEFNQAKKLSGGRSEEAKAWMAMAKKGLRSQGKMNFSITYTPL